MKTKMKSLNLMKRAKNSLENRLKRTIDLICNTLKALPQDLPILGLSLVAYKDIR